MTLEKMITRVRNRSRSDSDFITGTEVQDAIDEAVKRLAKDVGGSFVKDVYLAIAPKYWTATMMAIRLTITGGTNALAAVDIAITDTARTGTTGTVVASDLQAAIVAAGASGVTVTFSTTTFKFTIDASDSTSITVGAPTTATYADATDLLFGKADTQTATSWVSSIGQDALMEVDLPSDYMPKKVYLEWDRDPLQESTFDLFTSPQTHGTPHAFHIQNKKLRLYYSPTEQKLLFMRYHYLPATLGLTAGYQEFGLSSKVGSTETGLTGSTQYYLKINIDSAGIVEYDITTASDTTFTAVIALLNAAISGVTFALSGGDLRCTSNTTGVDSTISITAGTTGTDFLATLTGFSAMDAAVYEGDDEVDVPDEGEDAVFLYAVSVMWESKGDEKRAIHYLSRYGDAKLRYKIMVDSQSTKYRQHKKPSRPMYKVTF